MRGSCVKSRNCAPNSIFMFCHGERGEGGHGGGKPLVDARSAELVIQTVSEGRKDMPPFGAALTGPQIRDVAAYVATRLPH